MVISCSIVVVFSRRSSSRRTDVRIARKPFWLSLSRQLNRQLMHAVMNELPVSRRNSSKPPCSSLEPPRSRDADDVIRLAGENRLDEQRNVLGIVRSIGVEENRHRRVDVRNGAPNRLALAAARRPASTRRAAPRRDVGRSIGRPPDDDEDLVRVAARAIDDAADARRFLLGGDDDGHVGGDVMRRRHVEPRRVSARP